MPQPHSTQPPRIRPAEPSDRGALRHIHTSAFGRRDEADLVEALIAEGYARVSLLTTLGDEPVAHILFTALPLFALDAARTVPGVALAPLAVLPKLQRRGLGAGLIQAGLVACREQGAQVAVVLGHPSYYPRFGFSAERAQTISAPWSGPSFMALELLPGSLAGGPLAAQYAQPFLRPPPAQH